jgi:hypothetical protein
MKISDSKEVTEFRSIATYFCKLVRSSKSYGITDFLSKLEKLLPLLCYSVQLLPQVQQSPYYDREWSLKKWKKIHIKLRRYLGKYDTYCHVFEPYKPDDTEPAFSSLSDDLSDIYSDLSPGLTAWQYSDSAKRRAIIDNWQTTYRMHWGWHVASAWRAIYFLINHYEVGIGYEVFKGHRKRQ